jgi:hypothetical protein
VVARAVVLVAPVARVVEAAAEETPVDGAVGAPVLDEVAPAARWAAEEPIDGRIEPNVSATTAATAAAVAVTAATARRRRSVAARR